MVGDGVSSNDVDFTAIEALKDYFEQEDHDEDGGKIAHKCKVALQNAIQYHQQRGRKIRK